MKMHDSTALTIFVCAVKGMLSLNFVDNHVKYSQDEYVIEKDYEEALRDRASLFKYTQKTKKDLRYTFITLYGVKANKYSRIVNDNIIIDDLFK